MKSHTPPMPLLPLAGLIPGVCLAALIGTNMNVQVQNTVDTAITDASAITQASPGEVTTASPHGLSNGDIVVFNTVVGMVELEGQAVRVASVASTTFELEGLDTTDYSAFTSASFQEVTAFHTINTAQSVTMPDTAPNKIDITTLIDKVKQIAFGLPEAPDGSMTGLYDPANAGVAAIKAATKANEDLVFKVNWAGGQTTLFNALVSGGSGFDLTQNDAAKQTISFTPVKDVMYYAS